MTRADVFSVEKRSEVMRAVKSRDTKPELAVRAAVRDLGLARRYRLGGRSLPGKPDLVFPSLGKVIFVHGCFWHGHDCARGARAPKDNSDYWRNKIERNRARDARTLVALKDLGWRALTVWECHTNDDASLSTTLKRFLADAKPRPCPPRKSSARRRQT